jgi:hypothetical protein
MTMEKSMNHIVRRPRQLDPGADFMRQSHFQVAYVTTDLVRAKAIVGEHYGLTQFKEIEGEMPRGDGYLRVSIGWVGSVMYEFIQAEGPGAEFYTSRLPKEGFAIRHHHLGYLVESQAGWEALEARIAREGRPVVFRSEMEGFMRAIYIDAPELGHYLEYIYPEPPGVEFFESAPNN